MRYSTCELSTSEGYSKELKELVARISHEQDQAAQVYCQLRIVYTLLSRVGAADIESYGVQAAYYGVLYALQGGKEATPSQLRHYVLSGVSNVTALIDRMVRDGLVRRWHDEDDRRKVKICLTERGEEACQQVVPGHVAWVKKTMSIFSEGDLKQFDRLLGRLWQAVRSQEIELNIENAEM